MRRSIFWLFCIVMMTLGGYLFGRALTQDEFIEALEGSYVLFTCMGVWMFILAFSARRE